ncbi:hypothetical protein UFOVP1537_32 [uncultured Caudovirales phage]|uniref:Uncharacterized protein n=2 Tax=root TaxID=1 RepID=A0A6J7XVH0_9CAUD|nr:hypothetical protein UFOVP825_50 [uncultured Caudovirales phage]CAB4171271.1 hypothetical protein UFOVP915_32 [uncultured Caudovirales phage]CAB4177232.1 hypothetical protein UFOVP1000_49 [uncultured Caudovirales phage]CAB4182871.1 hypothetical protein UFOVP1092_24 [uncultured Caudovirales phage]CAB4187538.1 hypothetical protein UFOVP1152_28 [uncultured Caudovirales phage]
MGNLDKLLAQRGQRDGTIQPQQGVSPTPESHMTMFIARLQNMTSDVVATTRDLQAHIDRLIGPAAENSDKQNTRDTPHETSLFGQIDMALIELQIATKSYTNELSRLSGMI